MLESSPLSQCLERKSKILGYELFDLFFIFFSMAIFNFIFSGFSHRTVLVWGPTAALALLLRVSKAGKPDNYLKHLLLFHLTAKTTSAFPLCRTSPPLRVLPHDLGDRNEG